MIYSINLTTTLCADDFRAGERYYIISSKDETTPTIVNVEYVGKSEDECNSNFKGFGQDKLTLCRAKADTCVFRQKEGAVLSLEFRLRQSMEDVAGFNSTSCGGCDFFMETNGGKPVCAYRKEWGDDHCPGSDSAPQCLGKGRRYDIYPKEVAVGGISEGCIYHAVMLGAMGAHYMEEIVYLKAANRERAKGSISFIKSTSMKNRGGRYSPHHDSVRLTHAEMRRDLFAKKADARMILERRLRGALDNLAAFNKSHCGVCGSYSTLGYSVDMCADCTGHVLG